MARTLAELPKGARITDFVSLGVLAEKFPRTTIDRILQETGRASKRERNLPAHVVVYYVIALALYGQVSYGEVLRCLLEGLEWLGLNVRRLRGTAKSAITQARSRLGKEPLQRLYQEVVSPIATPQTQGAWYRGRRLVTLDGSTLDLADTAANEAAFGRPGASRGRSGYPQLRFVALLENGTHVLFATDCCVWPIFSATVEAVPRRRQPPVVAREKEPEAALSGAFGRWLLSARSIPALRVIEYRLSSLVYYVAAIIRPGCVSLRRPPRRTARVRLRGPRSQALPGRPLRRLATTSGEKSGLSAWS